MGFFDGLSLIPETSTRSARDDGSVTGYQVGRWAGDIESEPRAYVEGTANGDQMGSPASGTKEISWTNT